jgi:PilZ domain
MSYSAVSSPRADRPAHILAVVADEPQLDADRRRHVRFEVSLLGRFMRPDRQEFPCRAISLSVGDAHFMSPVPVPVGERIVAYLDEIGGIEGTVTRVEDGAFALRINASQHKREKLAAQITWLINRSELEGIDARRAGHERIASSDKRTMLRLPDDQEIEVRLQDVSISGASILIASRPPLGAVVSLGKLRARVVRHHAEGVGVQFLDIQNPDALRRYFG